MYANGYMTSSSSGHSAITQSKHQSKDSEKATTSTILPSAVLRWLTRRSIAWFGRIICKVTIQAGDWMKGIQLLMLYLMESEKENMFYGIVQWKLVTSSLHPASYNSFFFPFFFSFIFISWRLITSQHCSGFCHTLTWISHGVTSIPHPDPPSHLPLHPIPLGLPSAPGPSTCLMNPNSKWSSRPRGKRFKGNNMGKTV